MRCKDCGETSDQPFVCSKCREIREEQHFSKLAEEKQAKGIGDEIDDIVNSHLAGSQ